MHTTRPPSTFLGRVRTVPSHHGQSGLFRCALLVFGCANSLLITCVCNTCRLPLFWAYAVGDCGQGMARHPLGRWCRAVRDRSAQHPQHDPTSCGFLQVHCTRMLIIIIIYTSHTRSPHHVVLLCACFHVALCWHSCLHRNNIGASEERNEELMNRVDTLYTASYEQGVAGLDEATASRPAAGLIPLRSCSVQNLGGTNGCRSRRIGIYD